MTRVKDPREDLSVLAPFNSITWGDWKGWTIRSRGCSCCSTDKKEVSVEDLQKAREELLEAVNRLDQIIMAARVEG